MQLIPLYKKLRSIICLPKVRLNLSLADTKGNDPFFAKVVKEFFESAMKRHTKFPLVRNLQVGLCICPLPYEFEDYFSMVEASARRNFKKAQRLGYEFSLIDYNQYLDDIGEIRQSTDKRQGKVPDELKEKPEKVKLNPPSKNNAHDYPTFGILKDGKLVVQASLMIAGDVALIQHILGHAKYHSDGVVPFMILSMVKYVLANHPKVKFFGYGTYYGALTDMQRFKAKFAFLPHWVTWDLGDKKTSQLSQKAIQGEPKPKEPVSQKDGFQLVYRQKRWRFLPLLNRKDVEFVLLDNPLKVLLYADYLFSFLKGPAFIKTLAKVATYKRSYYCLFMDQKVVSTGWLTHSISNLYTVEENDMVIGPIWTSDEYRRRGLGTYALKSAINRKIMAGHRVFWIDTATHNIASQKLIKKCGFGEAIKALAKKD